MTISCRPCSFVAVFVDAHINDYKHVLRLHMCDVCYCIYVEIDDFQMTAQ